ncbi:MFS transporter [Geomesophilobacter sediminis]|uniref:MFS transporter n=1 Tax=Geomesophilobacter sediminis TaxID=2798584 RepID=A0A8J7LWR0_9BACT|nr:MFS transporter [Geomesophilobacter sediminis]MBJ6726130.1 MFS transporter [Geomesophilobacter sediminis]
MPEQYRMRRQRWIIFGILALSYILAYFYRVSLAVVAGDISRELHLSPQQLGSLSSILFYVYAAAQIPLGPLIDRLGGRLVIGCSGLLTTIGGILFSQATTIATALGGRVLIGVGTASVLMATLAIFSRWFSQQEFGKVSGLMVAIGNVGNVAGTAPLALAVAAIGWRDSFLTIGVVQGVAALLVLAFLRNRPPEGMHTGAEHDDAGPEEMLRAWKTIFTTLDFWLVGLAAFAWYGAYLALQALWGGPYLMEVLKYSRVETGRMLMATSVGFITGSLMIDSIARKVLYSYRKTLRYGQIGLFALMLNFLGMAERLPVGVLLVLFFLIGICVSSGVMIYPIVRGLFSVRIVGTALTSLNFFVLMGAATAQQVMGEIIGAVRKLTPGDAAAAFHAGFKFPIGCLAVAIVLFFFSRGDEPVTKPHPHPVPPLEGEGT